MSTAYDELFKALQPKVEILINRWEWFVNRRINCCYLHCWSTISMDRWWMLCSRMVCWCLFFFIYWTQVDKMKLEVCWCTDIEQWNPHNRWLCKTCANKCCQWIYTTFFSTEYWDKKYNCIRCPGCDKTSYCYDNTCHE